MRVRGGAGGLVQYELMEQAVGLLAVRLYPLAPPGLGPLRVVAGQIEIATYSYDGGKKPYSPPDPHLLQPFSTLLATNVSYQLRMHVGAVDTSFVLGRAGVTLETKVNQHANACTQATMGYKLGFFFGGQCSAPQPVTACYSEQPKR